MPKKTQPDTSPHSNVLTDKAFVQKSLFDDLNRDDSATKSHENTDAVKVKVSEQNEVSRMLAEKAADDRLLSRLNSMTTAELEGEVRRHNDLYNRGTPEISDSAYDRLVQHLRDVCAESDIADELTTPDLSSPERAKITHKVPMRSIRKPNVHRVFYEIGNWLKEFSGDVIATPKIDGLSCSLEYDSNGDLFQASTRGQRGIEGDDITANVRYIDTIPQHIDHPDLEVRGEVYMPRDAFDDFEGEKISARNLAVGGLKQKDARETAKYRLSFFAYEALGDDFESDTAKLEELKRLGFIVPESWLFKRTPDDARLLAELEHFSRRMTDARETWNFDADGIVFKANDSREQLLMGTTEHHPKCAIAFKFPSMEEVSVLREVRWQVAKGARITPVAVFDTVELAGAMVQKATLSNAGMVTEFPFGSTQKGGQKTWLKIGSRILVSRRGDVIPHVEYVIDEPEGAVNVEIPTTCPSCGSHARRDGLFLLCTDPDSCPATGQALIENYTKIAGCMGFGEKIIENLYDAGLVETPADLYRLTVESLAQALSSSDDGTVDPDAVMPAKLYDSIQKTRALPLARFLESLSIPALGRVNSRDIANKMISLANVLHAEPDDFVRIVGGKSVDPERIEKYARQMFERIHRSDIAKDTVLNEDVLSAQKHAKKEIAEILKHYSTQAELSGAAYQEIYHIALETYRGDRTAQSIYQGLKQRGALIEDLLRHVTVEDAEVRTPADNIFAGKSFLFTGSLEHMKREEAQARVEALGGTAAGSVTKTLNVLVATSNTSTKWQKAQQLNEKGASILLWTEDEFIAALENAEKK